MLRNYLKIAFRNLFKQKGYSFINISGLAVGIAVVTLITLWIQDELSYDKFNKKSDRVYRVVEIQSAKGRNPTHVPYTMVPLAEALKMEMPEIEETVRINYAGQMAIAYKDKSFFQNDVVLAGENFFNIFSFDVIKGSAVNALKEPFSVVICEKIAKKYFGDEDPIGKQITLASMPATVTAVIKNPPVQSHMKFEIIISFSTMYYVVKNFGQDPEEWRKSWESNSLFTYVLLKKNTKPESLNSQFPAFLTKYRGEESTMEMYLQNIEDIYLNSEIIGYSGPWIKGDKKHIYIFSAIALFILLIACINFMNLTTARSSGRAKEVGMRKVIGGTKLQLIKQFLSESFLVTLFAMLIAVALIEFSLPYFNNLASKELTINFFSNWKITGGFVIIVLFVSVVAGAYPAFFLSSFEPAKVLKGSLSSGSKNLALRKTLVVIQFSISIVLLIGTWIIFRQMDFMQNKKLGFDKENVIVVNNLSPGLKSKLESYKNLLSGQHSIVSATVCSQAPGSGVEGEWGMRPEGSNEQEQWTVPLLGVDEDYLKTFDLKMAKGRWFSKEFQSDRGNSLVINETAAKKFGWKNPLGKEIVISDRFLNDGKGKVVGVVKDYYFKSLHQKIEPVVFLMHKSLNNDIAVKIEGGDIKGTIAFLKQKWLQFSNNEPFKFTFLDESIDQLYRTEMRVGKLFVIFSILAIIIASLGLLGLAAYSAEQRTKEIGVRKVMGATISQIILLLSKDFTKWVLLSNIIAWPVAWYLMNKWLANFAYRTNINIMAFIGSAVLVLLIAFFTVSFIAIKAASANPINSLKYE